MPGDIRLSSTAGPVASGDHDCYVPGLPHVVLNLSAEDAAAGVGTVIDDGQRPGVTSQEDARIKQLEQVGQATKDLTASFVRTPWDWTACMFKPGSAVC